MAPNLTPVWRVGFGWANMAKNVTIRNVNTTFLLDFYPNRRTTDKATRIIGGHKKLKCPDIISTDQFVPTGIVNKPGCRVGR